MPRNDSKAYIDEVVMLVTPAACSGSFMGLELDDFSELGERYGLDRFDVLQDCMDAYNEIRIIRDIQSGHDYHAETEDPVPIDELVGRGMITEHTVLMTVEEFISQVERGHINDYDGYGEFVSGDAGEFFPVRCHVAWLREFRDEWPYVAWYGS